MSGCSFHEVMLAPLKIYKDFVQILCRKVYNFVTDI